MINPDNPLIILVILVGLVSGIIFVGSQYELCIAMPQQWFAGFVSGMVLAVCLAVLYSRRDER